MTDPRTTRRPVSLGIRRPEPNEAALSQGPLRGSEGTLGLQPYCQKVAGPPKPTPTTFSGGGPGALGVYNYLEQVPIFRGTLRVKVLMIAQRAPGRPCFLTG